MNLLKKNNYFPLLNIKITALTLSQVIEFIKKTIDEKQRRLIFTINLDHLQKISKNKKFKETYCQANLIVADGTPIVWLSKIFGSTKLPCRVNGTNLVKKILEISTTENFRIFLLGGRKKTLEKLKEKYPRAKIVGIISPPFNQISDWPNSQYRQQITKSKANIVLVALGAPRQEKWLVKNFFATGANIGVGVGSAVELLAGIKKRAPVWMQKSGLEWLFRLIQEPKRLGRRYLNQLFFIPRLLVKLIYESCYRS